MKGDSEREIEEWCLERVGKEKFKRGALRLKRVLLPYLESFKQKNMYVVTVGGTNGKGETVYTLSHLLKERGIRHVLWVSPHVLTIRERISADGEMISYEKLFELLKSEYARVIAMGEEVSYYELMLCAFLAYIDSFPKGTIEVCLLEVGLGGRLDGVNLLDADLTAVTSISRDHQDVLGPEYCMILKEKLGITRRGAPLVSALELNYCQEITEEFCRDKGVEWIDLFREGALTKSDSFSDRNKLLALVLDKIIVRDFDISELSLLRKQVESEEMRALSFKGRSEKWSVRGRELLFFGSHNIDGARKLVQLMQGRSSKVDRLLVALSKRSYAEEPMHILRALYSLLQSGIVKEIVLTEFQHQKAMKIDDDFLRNFSENSGVSLKEINRVLNWKEWILSEELQGQQVLVTGSYYFIGCVQEFIQKQEELS
ncbi:MAG: hypothetical protein HQK52_07850 [Oligoflexia bacterium]|nr:hypothetical protein [Oligoflexia bacterium]